MEKKHESIGVGGGFLIIYMYGTHSLSLLHLYFGAMTWKIITWTWLDVAEFLSEEPPAGKNTGSMLRAAVSELTRSAAKEEGGK